MIGEKNEEVFKPILTVYSGWPGITPEPRLTTCMAQERDYYVVQSSKTE